METAPGNKITDLRTQIMELGLTLDPVISEADVLEREAQYGFTLPEAYRAFITQVGDGGQVPGFTADCDRLISFGRYEEEGYSLKRVSKPFKLKQSWSGESEARWNMILNDGHLLLADDATDNNTQWFLIVTGPRRGEVWLRAEDGVQRTDRDFLSWLSLHLSGGLSTYLKEFKEHEFPKFTPLEECQRELKRDRIRLNPPISLERVREFEQRHHIALPEEYVQFITELGDGAQKLPPYINQIYALSELNCLDDLDHPFFFQTSADLKHYLMDKSTGRFIHFGGVERKDGMLLKRKTVWEHLSDYLPIDAQAKGPWRFPEFQMLHGCMPLMLKDRKEGNGYKINQYVLILNGEFKGEVWSFSVRTISGRWSFPRWDIRFTPFTYIKHSVAGIY